MISACITLNICLLLHVVILAHLLDPFKLILVSLARSGAGCSASITWAGGSFLGKTNPIYNVHPATISSYLMNLQ